MAGPVRPTTTRDAPQRPLSPSDQVPASRRLLAGALWLVTLIGATAMVIVWFSVNAVAAEPGPLTDGVLFVILAIDAFACATIGALIVVRQPRNWIGWLLSLVGVTIVGAFNGFGIGVWRAATFGRDDALGGWFGLLGVTSILALMAMLGAIALLFPSGRVPSRRWSHVAALPYGVLVASMVSTLVQPEWDIGLARNPIGIQHPLVESIRPLLGVGSVVALATFGVGAAAIVWRFIGSTGEVRQQVKWFAASVALVVITQFLELTTGSDLMSLVSAAAVALLPVSIGLAVLRYHLYAIDRIISRTLGWGVISGILGATFLAGLIGLQAALSGVMQSDTIAVAASTLLALALFQPVRRRVQAAVDRRFDRTRYDAAAVVERFSSRLRNQLDLRALGGEIEQAASSAVRPSSVAVWLRSARARQ